MAYERGQSGGMRGDGGGEGIFLRASSRENRRNSAAATMQVNTELERRASSGERREGKGVGVGVGSSGGEGLVPVDEGSVQVGMRVVIMGLKSEYAAVTALNGRTARILRFEGRRLLVEVCVLHHHVCVWPRCYAACVTGCFVFSPFRWMMMSAHEWR